MSEVDAAAAREVLRTSLRERLAALRGTSGDALPPALLDITVQRVALPGGEVFLVRPTDWEQLRHEEGGAGRPVPYWATAWPSGRALAAAVAAAPPPPAARVLELGCGLGLPSIAAARAGARVLATDGSTDAVAFAAHALASRGPFDVVLAADVLYTKANVDQALRLLPRLLAPGGELRIADPRRAGARAFLAAARATFRVRTTQDGDVALHTLRRRTRT